jgi:hypothetical protein
MWLELEQLRGITSRPSYGAVPRSPSWPLYKWLAIRIAPFWSAN